MACLSRLGFEVICITGPNIAIYLLNTYKLVRFVLSILSSRDGFDITGHVYKGFHQIHHQNKQANANIAMVWLCKATSISWQEHVILLNDVWERSLLNNCQSLFNIHTRAEIQRSRKILQSSTSSSLLTGAHLNETPCWFQHSISISVLQIKAESQETEDKLIVPQYKPQDDIVYRLR